MDNIDHLKIIASKFKRNLDVLYDNWSYTKIFGCSKAQSHYMSFVRLRVEMRAINNNEYKFFVFVDFHLPIAVDYELAEHYKKATNSAVRKAKWAKKLVDGYVWSREEVMILENLKKKNKNGQ